MPTFVGSGLSRTNMFRMSLFGALALGALLATLSPVASAAASCEIDGVQRVVAIGDVHGAYDRFVSILTASGLIDNRQRWSGGKTHLVQAGDIVDRGPDSRKALDLLRRLESEASRAGGQVHVLLGNHEVNRMLGDLRFTTPGEYEAFVTRDSEDMRLALIKQAKTDDRDALLKQMPLGQVELRVAFGREGTYGKWLRTLDTMVRINGVVFVHGGISAATAAMSCDAINKGVRRELTEDIEKTRSAPLVSLGARVDGPTNYRGLAQEPDSFESRVDEILSQQSARAIVTAHTLTPDGRVRVRFGGKVIQIDTGMQPAYAPDGRASALEMSGSVFTAIYEDRRDTIGTW